MYEPLPCAKCLTMCEFVATCPRLGIGHFLCPNCDEKEYMKRFPPMEYRLIHDRLQYKFEKAQQALQTFSAEYAKNPKQTLAKYK